jgi:hypothetical protein
MAAPAYTRTSARCTCDVSVTHVRHTYTHMCTGFHGRARAVAAASVRHDGTLAPPYTHAPIQNALMRGVEGGMPGPFPVGRWQPQSRAGRLCRCRHCACPSCPWHSGRVRRQRQSSDPPPRCVHARPHHHRFCHREQHCGGGGGGGGGTGTRGGRPCGRQRGRRTAFGGHIDGASDAGGGHGGTAAATAGRRGRRHYHRRKRRSDCGRLRCSCCRHYWRPCVDRHGHGWYSCGCTPSPAAKQAARGRRPHCARVSVPAAAHVPRYATLTSRPPRTHPHTDRCTRTRRSLIGARGTNGSRARGLRG